MNMLSVIAEPSSLDDWLVHIESLTARPIDLGLERIGRVWRALDAPPTFAIVTVGGTNGKGSTCTFLESILGSAGYSVGMYTSPHFLRHNERVRVDGTAVSDAALCTAFSAVERARGDIPLSYFEFGTLAAMLLFVASDVDVAILEVGLGGRLDAVNVFDSQCAVVTSVDMDHMDYLGPTREEIGYEKAGIFRQAIPAICADPDPPASVSRQARTVDARLLRIGQDFGYAPSGEGWRYWGPKGDYPDLPLPRLVGECQLMNASAAIAALQEIRGYVPVTVGDIRTGLEQARLAGRFEVFPGPPTVILDIAHNPQAAATLATNLARMPCRGNTYAVFAMLGDKDVAGVVRTIKGQIDVWIVAGIAARRGTSSQQILDTVLAEAPDAATGREATPALAFARARCLATRDDRIVVFGSFHTVTAVMKSAGLCSL